MPSWHQGSIGKGRGKGKMGVAGKRPPQSFPLESCSNVAVISTGASVRRAKSHRTLSPLASDSIGSGRHKKEMAKLGTKVDHVEDNMTQKELDSIKQRLIVLERIVTDKQYDLNAQISDLEK